MRYLSDRIRGPAVQSAVFALCCFLVELYCLKCTSLFFFPSQGAA